MGQIDNDKMWASLYNFKPTDEQRQTVIEVLNRGGNPACMVIHMMLENAIKEQGLEFKDGNVASIEPEFKPKFSLGNWITDGDSVYQVDGIDMYYNKYTLITKEGKKDDFVFSWIDKNFHLCTQEEAPQIQCLSLKYKINDTIKYNGINYLITGLSDFGYYVRALFNDEDAVTHIGFNAPIELVEENGVPYDKLRAMLDEALSKETAESWNERLNKSEWEKEIEAFHHLAKHAQMELDLKEISKTLLRIAREQIIKEIDVEALVDKYDNNYSDSLMRDWMCDTFRDGVEWTIKKIQEG